MAGYKRFLDAAIMDVKQGIGDVALPMNNLTFLIVRFDRTAFVKEADRIKLKIGRRHHHIAVPLTETWWSHRCLLFHRSGLHRSGKRGVSTNLIAVYTL